MTDRPPSTAPRGAGARLALLGIATLVAGFLWIAAWPFFAGNTPIHANGIIELATLGVHESSFFVAATIVELVLTATLTTVLGRRWAAAWDERWTELTARPGAAYAVLAACSASLALIVGLGLLEGHPITEDEKTYLYQAHLLLEGRLSDPIVPEARAFYQPFLVLLDGNTRWTGQYFWGQPLLLAIASLAHATVLLPPLELAVTVFFTGKLAEEVYDDVRVGVLAAVLAGACPMLVMTAGTLHSANLAGATSAVTLWALARLAKRAASSDAPGTWSVDRTATIALGLAVGVSAHNRLLDELAILVGAAIVLVARFRHDLSRPVRAIAPSVLVALPLLALVLVANKATWGGYTTTGYALFNGRHKTMGFGYGPNGTLHSVALAAAKTLTVAARLAFYVTGSPVGLAFLALPALGLAPSNRRALAPLAPVVCYLVGYFFYAGSSIDPTGPVYYIALCPVLAAWIAAIALSVHDRLRATRWSRLVPALLVAQFAAGVVVFWPPEILYLHDDVTQAKECETTVASAGITRGLVFTLFGPGWPGMTSWHRKPPMTWAPFDQPLLFAHAGGIAKDLAAARRFAGDRPVYLERCFSADPPEVLHYDPATGNVTSLDGTRSITLVPDKPDAPPGVGDYLPLYKVF